MDFNTKNTIENNYIDSPIIYDDLELFKQELDVLLNSERGEIYCDNKAGSDIEDMLWKFKVSESQLQRNLYNKINSECLMSQFFDFSISIKFTKGELRDIALIDINIDDKNNVKFLYQ